MSTTYRLARESALGRIDTVDQHLVNVVVNALVVRVDNVAEVRGLQQISIVEGLGYEFFRLTNRGKWVGAVADYEYRYATPVERPLERLGGELIVERAGTGERRVH